MKIKRFEQLNEAYSNHFIVSKAIKYAKDNNLPNMRYYTDSYF